MNEIEYLYNDVVQVGIFNGPEVFDLDHASKGHTMGGKLVEYVEIKFSQEQKEIFNKCITSNIDIKIHGAYIGHISYLLRKHNCEYSIQEASKHISERIHSNKIKNFNNKRPIMFFVKRKSDGLEALWIIVFPSNEYVYQYSELVVAYVKYCCYNNVSNISSESEVASRDNYISQKIMCFIYPKLSSTVSKWTGLEEFLNNDLIMKDELVVIGYVETLFKRLVADGFQTKYKNGFKRFGLDDIYGIAILRSTTSKKRVVLIGFNHSYWGSASSIIAASIIEAGCNNLIYTAKAGSKIVRDPENMTVNDRITGAVYIIRGPYYIWDYPDVDHVIGNISQSYNVKSRFDDFAARGKIVKVTNNHISVPTVVSETFTQAAKYHECNPTTIDNEIGYIARVISKYNERNDFKIEFSCLHYITDYVTSSVTQYMSNRSGLDVDNMREKEQVLCKAYEVLANYCEDTGIEDNSVYYDYTYLKANTNTSYKSDGGVPLFMLPRNEYLQFKDDNHSLSTIDTFVQLIGGKRRNTYKKLQPINRAKKIQTILKNNLEESRRHTVAIQGEIGSGKSMVIAALYYLWLNEYKKIGSTAIPVFIDLSKIEKLLCHSSNPNNEMQKAFNTISKYCNKLSNEGNRLVLFIDGADEYSPISTSFFTEYMNNSILKKYNKIIALRRYPHKKFKKSGKRIGKLFIYDTNLAVKFNILKSNKNDIDNKVVSKLSILLNRDEIAINKGVNDYMSLFGKDEICFRLLAIIITMDDFDASEFEHPSEFLQEFIDYYLSREDDSWGTGDYSLSEVSSITFEMLISRNLGVAKLLKSILYRRISTQSNEMLYYLCAYYVCNKILQYGSDSEEIDALKELDHVYHNKINRYAKDIINSDDELQSRYFESIVDIYGNAGERLQAFLVYLCGRFNNDSVIIRSREFLNTLKNRVIVKDFLGKKLVLNRTIYISLIYLGDSAEDYIKLMRENPEWDEANRGFHLSYYEDKDYFSNPDMIAADDHPVFINTKNNLVTKIKQDDRDESLSNLTSYTLFSLIFNRYRDESLEKTMSVKEVVRLGEWTMQNSDLSDTVYSFVETVVENLKDNSRPIPRLIRSMYNAKTYKRSGWNSKKNNRHVPMPESIADHVYMTMILAKVLLPETTEIQRKIEEKTIKENYVKYHNYNKEQIINMLLIHDIPENITGDIIRTEKPDGHVDKERKVMQKYTAYSVLTKSQIGNLYLNFENPWEMFEEKPGNINTIIAKEIDSIECLIQLNLYCNENNVSIPDKKQFERGLKKDVKTYIGKQILAIVEQL